MWRYTPTNELMHYGKKGMKWGQRRAVKKQAKALKKSQTAWDDNVNKNWHLAYNKAANEANEKLIPKLNKKYEGVNFNDPKNAAIEAKYDKEVNTEFNKLYAKHFVDTFGERPISSL